MAKITLQPGHAGKVDDAAASSVFSAYVAGKGPGAAVVAFQMHGQDSIPAGFFHFENRAVPQNARIVDQHVHAAENVDGGLNQTLTARYLSDRVNVGYGFAARCPDLSHNIIGNHGRSGTIGICAQIINYNPGSLGCRQQGKLSSNTLASHP